MNHYGPLLLGKMRNNVDREYTLRSPYDKHDIAIITNASFEEMTKAIEAQEHIFNVTKQWSSFQKSACLKKIAQLLKRNKITLAKIITNESGKPISASIAEVERAIYTFEVAAEETKRINGELIQLDTLSGHDNREGKVIYQSRGPVAGITPFNFPLNLVAHKVAPAIAAGNPIIIKPAPQTPISAIKLGEIVIESGWPKEAIAIMPCENQVAEQLVTDHRMKCFTFTGSDKVGWALKQMANMKSVTLELGGNAANIVHADANQKYALSRLIWGGFYNAGQTCVSAQRTYVHQSIYNDFKSKLITAVQKIPYGDPLNQDTLVGPLISREAIDKVMTLINTSLTAGAKCLVGGKLTNNVIHPTLIESKDDSLPIFQEEIFGPVLLITPYECLKKVIAKINCSRYGLQAGLFTNHLNTIQYATHHLDVGGLNINDVSTFRIDHMPYGGIKDSGCGHEGLKYAIREMMLKKLITYNYPSA